jgi:tetratricopeptide (TPR) repeat protein
MKESLLTAVIVTLLFNPVFSQSYKGQGRIKGIVTDAEGNPLEGVKIRLFSLRADSGFETESDKKGEWKANWIRSGMWYIDFTKLEYEPRKISISIIELGKNPLLEITMKKIEGVAIAEDIMKDFQKANKFYDEEEYEEAIAAYKRILTDHPDAFIINQNVGNAYFALKDYDRAIEFYKKVVERQEDSSQMFILIGNSYVNKQDNEKALQWYSKVNVGDIEDAIAVYNIGVLFFNSGNYEKAVTYLMRAVEIDKELSDAYYQLGMSYLAAGKNQEAREVLEKFLELNPESDKAGIAKSIIETLSKKKR